MGIQSLAARIAALFALHAAGVGWASPAVLVTRPTPRIVEWLPMDNQTFYTLEEGEKKTLELNTTSMSRSPVYITISPCSRDLHWTLYFGIYGAPDSSLRVIKDHIGEELVVLSLAMTQQERYVLQLSSLTGGGAAISVRGEPSQPARLRLRVRSKRRLAANWDASPIDPQTTRYCVVASRRKNYTSLCAAQFDIRTNRMERKSPRSSQSPSMESKMNNFNRISSSELDNQINIADDEFNIYGEFRGFYRRKKFGRSTKVTDQDPVLACVGEKTHHLIENLDPSTTYFVTVFGLSRDRRAGSMIASGIVRPRTSTAKRLRENLPLRADVRGRSVYYFKATLGSGGMWLTVTACGGAVDAEVSVRGKRLHLTRNIGTYTKFFIPAPATSSTQETSEESSIQFDSSSEEARMRYVIKITPTRRDDDGSVSVELTASTTRWGASTPELPEDGVRELRPRRSCKSLDIAFLPASHNATDVIRYCVTCLETQYGGSNGCLLKRSATSQCVDHVQRPASRVIVQKITGLRPGKKYAIQVTASNKGGAVPYAVLYADTNAFC